ncbi:hypothetical protein XELAEV_18005836mg [Xenopus laevis]|nr:hypothetical protein XELAEV_18005836mg [Xenopus laevis]
MKTKMRLENTMCLMNKYWENGLRALVFYAKMKPSDPLEKAIDFDKNYMALASQCCGPESLISECFETWSGVLFSRICTLMESNLQKACCLKSIPEREKCLTEIAIEESKTLPNISIEAEHLCRLRQNLQLLKWIVYEYSRRNPQLDVKRNLDSAVRVNGLITYCCATNNPSDCITSFSEHFHV